MILNSPHSHLSGSLINSWRAIGYLSKQWSGDLSRRGFLRLMRTSGAQWSGRRRAGNSCISRGPKSPLEKPDFSHLNNEHKVPRPQPLFFIYSLVIHTCPSPHEIALHHSTASRLPPFSTLHHITVPRLLFLQYYHIIVSRLPSCNTITPYSTTLECLGTQLWVYTGCCVSLVTIGVA